MTRLICDVEVGGRQIVAGRTERDVEPAVLVEGEIFPAVRRVGRHVVVDDLRLRHLVEVGFGIVVLVELVDIDDIERAVAVGDAGRHLHALEDGLDRALAALVGDRVDVGGQKRADEERAVLAPRHLPRLRQAARPQLDLEAGRQLDVLEGGFDLLVGEAGRRRQRIEDVRALLLLCLVAHEPVVWRMQPEVFLARVRRT